MKILLIAYYYPPYHASGGQRPLKMAEYLPQFGHDVAVLTSAYARNTSREKNIFRVYDPSHNKNRAGLRKIQWLFLRLAVELLNRLGICTSIYSLWKRAILRKADGIITQVKPEYILATYPPVETLEIGLFLKNKYQIPLLADFRDGLLFEAVEKKRMSRFACVRRHYAKIEMEVARQAAAICTVSPALNRYFAQKYGSRSLLMLANGFDEKDFLDLPAAIPIDRSKFNIVHTGNLGLSETGRSVHGLLFALQEIADRHPSFGEKMLLHLLGELQPNEKRSLKKLTASGMVIHHGAVPRSQALAWQKSADLLLLITAVKQQSVASGKLFEYLGAGKPILGLTWDTYAAEIIRETGSGWVIHPENSAEIADLLMAMIRQPRMLLALQRNEQAISRFSRPRQMRELAAFIHSLG